MNGKYAKLLGLHKKLSDAEIMKLLETGSIDIEGKKITVAKARRSSILFDDPFI